MLQVDLLTGSVNLNNINLEDDDFNYSLPFIPKAVQYILAVNNLTGDLLGDITREVPKPAI